MSIEPASRVRSIALLAALLAAFACSATDPQLPEDPVAALEMLRECPTGDAIWRQALGRAGSPELLSALDDDLVAIAEGCPERWEPHWTRGETLLRRSQLEQARVPYETALARAEALGDDTGIACAANRLGTIDYFTGSLDPAREQHELAAAAARRAGRDDLTAFALNNLAGDLRILGRIPRALVVFDEAVELLATSDLPGPARQAAYNQGVLALELGNVSDAAASFERVHEQSQQAGDARTASLAALALGNLQLTLEQPGDARVWFERALQHETPQTRVTSEMGLGRADLLEGSYDSAAERLDRSIALAVEHELGIDELLARGWRASLSWRAGEVDDAITRLRRVRADAQERGARQTALWFSSWTLGRIHLERGEFDEAISALHEALALVRSQDEQLDPLGAGLYFLLGKADPFADLAVAYARRSSDGAVNAFEIAESAHARALRNLGREPSSDGQALHGETAAMTIQNAAVVRRSLGEDELLLDYLIGADHGVVLALTREAIRVVEIAGWDELRPSLERYRDALKRPLHDFAAFSAGLDDLTPDLDAGHRLREALLDPLGDLWRDQQRIFVVPDRDLALLPFGALPWSAPAGDARVEFVGERIELALLPLAGATDVVGVGNGSMMFAGDPRPDKEQRFPALPRTRYELDSIGEIWRGAARVRELRAAEFTPEAFARGVRGTDMVHLATHALASTLDPRQCAVVFDRGETLGFDQIARLDFPNSLVVLSACRSGEGETIPGQGVVGLGWAFMLADARALTVSLWNVEDAASAELMIEMHRQLRLGHDAVSALSRAQRTLLVDRPHPAFWAPFVVYVNPIPD